MHRRTGPEGIGYEGNAPPRGVPPTASAVLDLAPRRGVYELFFDRAAGGGGRILVDSVVLDCRAESTVGRTWRNGPGYLTATTRKRQAAVRCTRQAGERHTRQPKRASIGRVVDCVPYYATRMYGHRPGGLAEAGPDVSLVPRCPGLCEASQLPKKQRRRREDRSLVLLCSESLAIWFTDRLANRWLGRRDWGMDDVPLGSTGLEIRRIYQPSPVESPPVYAPLLPGSQAPA